VKLHEDEGINMVLLSVLHGLSFSEGEKMLLEEGYIEEETIEVDDDSCDKLFLYPYTLFSDGKLIDRIYHAEYCNRDAYGDFEDFKVMWKR